MIDGINVSTLCLDDVRSQITIILQDPAMFSGTIRLNLDQLGSHTDAQLRDAFEKSRIKKFVATFDEGLDEPVSEYDESLSEGQPQIIRLTSALLRDTKALILDETSFPLNSETDQLVQELIGKHLKHATILKIAHEQS